MTAKYALSRPGLVVLLFVLAVLPPSRALADQDDPPTRAARLAYLEGSVSFQPAGTEDWVTPPVNRPLTTGDRLWSDRDGRVELQLGGSFLRLGNNSAVSFLNLGNSVTQIQLTAGSLLVRVRRLEDDETYEIDTPNLAFSILRPGLYRLSVDDTRGTTTIGVSSGQGEAAGAGAAYSVRAGEHDVFSGTDELVLVQQAYESRADAFDAWSASRDSRWERSASVRYVSPDVVGSEDLDEYGAWRPTPEYGNVWFPRGVAVGWAPYHDGHWAYVEPWGYTWVDDSAWGYAPFHYGRWISVRGAWGWVPAPPRQQGGVYVRAVYAPALVAWVGVGAGVAWFALGPREVYVPSYPVSRGYVHDINVSNTTVNTTVVNNIYNPTIVNKTVNVTNVTYVNRTVPGAVVGTTAQAFASARPVARNVVRVDERTVAGAPVRVFAPTTAPTKQAVLGSGHATVIKPPAAVQTREVIARTPPPPPPPAFERRQEAIRGNEGRPLSVAQVRQIQASAAPQAAAVRIAPPARMIASPATASPAPGAGQAGTAGTAPGRPATSGSEAVQPAPSPVHPRDIPTPARPPSPSSAVSVLEQRRLQEQQQLHAQQEAERARVQQQHDLEHQQLAKQQADEAQRHQVELQHQRETQQLMQKHAQEQQQLLEQHQHSQQQQRQLESQPPAQDRPGERPPPQITEAARPAPAPVHPNEIPAAPRPPSPGNASSALERQHLQEQQQLHTQQEAEIQRVQQQHDLEHAQLAKQQADEARRQQVELQHRQETQQLMQKHVQEQQQLLEQHQHQQQQSQQQSPPPAKGRGAERPPDTRP